MEGPAFQLGLVVLQSSNEADVCAWLFNKTEISGKWFVDICLLDLAVGMT